MVKLRSVNTPYHSCWWCKTNNLSLLPLLL